MRTETTVGLFVLGAIGIFFFMTFQLGVFRIDRARYSDYAIFFPDVSGLFHKADVKIAGVKVGWVDKVELVDDGRQVKATIMIGKHNNLYGDAYAIVRQEGLLGTKYLEIVPGDPLLPAIQPGGFLSKPSKEPVSMDQILYQVKDIAQNIEEVTKSLKESLGGSQGVNTIQQVVNNINDAAQHIAAFSQACDRLIGQNESALNGSIKDISELARELKEQMPRVMNEVRSLASTISTDIVPAFNQNVERIGAAIDRDFSRVANKFESAATSLEDVTHKISKGKGVIGQLLNDNETSRDLKSTIQSIKRYFSRIDRLGIVIDAHAESMHGLANNTRLQDGKGYLNLRIHPTEDYFYLAGIGAAFSGRIERMDVEREWFTSDSGCKEFIPSEMHLTDAEKLKYAPLKKKVYRYYDKPFFNLQFGKIYNNVAFRFGLFESSAGVGVDIELPFGKDNFRWVTTFEAFDFRGRNRINDDRPHFKWLNSVFFTRNIYAAFGADDFVSKTNKSAFFGFGIRFGDDDLKYLFSKTNISV